MKVQFSNVILVLSVLVLLGSCTIEKRLYRPGLNVDWKGFTQQKITPKSATDELTSEIKIEKQESTLSNEYNSIKAIAPTVDPIENEPFQVTNATILQIKNNTESVERSALFAKAIVQDIPAKSKLNMNTQLEKRILSQNSNGGKDLLYSIGWILLLAVMVTLMILGILIGFAFIFKLFLILLFSILIATLVYVFGLALL